MKRFVLLISLVAAMGAAIFAQNAALPRLAVVEFTINVNTEKAKADAITVRNQVESRMAETRKYRMMTRNEIDQLLANQRIQVSSISSAENRKKLELEQISYIITGSLDAMGNDYAVTVRVLDVSNGEYPTIKDDLMGSGSRELRNGVNSLMAEFITEMTRSGVGGTYKIGDRGPAGGIVFYDKGFITDGWRYLEAAPAEAEFKAEWGGYRIREGIYAEFYDIPGTEKAVGSGKRNTQIIINRLKQYGENDRAAQICAGMDINGFTDWFLPSADELDLMDKNLKQKGLGGFSNDWYWSSSSEDNYAWALIFIDADPGLGVYNLKFNTNSVRAVRAF